MSIETIWKTKKIFHLIHKRNDVDEKLKKVGENCDSDVDDLDDDDDSDVTVMMMVDLALSS